MTRKLKAAIIGSGNIGTDLMIKILRHGQRIQMGAMVGIDAASDGLARAARMGVATTHEGVEGLTRLPVFQDIDFVFDATSASAHIKNDVFLRGLAKHLGPQMGVNFIVENIRGGSGAAAVAKVRTGAPLNVPVVCTARDIRLVRPLIGVFRSIRPYQVCWAVEPGSVVRK